MGYDDQYEDLLHRVDGNYELLRDDAGFIEQFEYDSASGFLTRESIQQGELGTAITLRGKRTPAPCPANR